MKPALVPEEKKMSDFFCSFNKEAYEGAERREFLRLPCETALKFTACREGLLQELQMGTTQNVSQTGMLFNAKNSPSLSSVILIEIDLKTLSNCIEVEGALVELNGRIMGKVVRVKPVEVGLYEIAVQFIRVGQENNKEVASVIQTANTAG